MSSIKAKQKEHSRTNTPNLDSLESSKVQLQKNHPSTKNHEIHHQEQNGNISRQSRGRTSNKSHRSQYESGNYNKQEQNKDQEDNKSRTQNKQSQDGQIKRSNLKPTKNNSSLMLKYKARPKNTSRNDQKSYISTNSRLDKRRTFSSAKNNIDQSEKSEIHRDDDVSNYKEENKRLRNKSQFLMQQLRKLQDRLNKQLTKRGSPQKRKQRTLSLDKISNKQVLNADKRCRIYQRDILILKQKASMYTQEKVNQLTSQIKKLKQERQQMQTDKKQLKKQVKKYEKIVQQIGDGDYLKLKQNNEFLKSENNKLKSKIKKQEQQQRIQKISACNSKAKNKKQEERISKQKKKQQEKQQKQIHILKSKSQRDDKKIKSLIYENNNNKQKLQQLQNQLKQKNKQIQTLKDRLAKYNRLEKKKKEQQNKKQRQQQERKNKQKQNNKMHSSPTSRSNSKSKSKSKSNQQSQKRSQSNNSRSKSKSKSKSRSRQESKRSRSYSKSKSMSKSKQKSRQRSRQRSKSIQKYIQKKISKSKSKPKSKNTERSSSRSKKRSSNSSEQKQKKSKSKSKSKSKEISQNKKQIQRSINKQNGRYPKKMEKGQGNIESYKWNHHPYSSKIKQIQVMPHSNGHIKCLNFRYEKGEPSRIEKGNYASFICDQNNGEYIKQVNGGFKAGILQYIKVITNNKRQAVFCKHQIAEECDSFTFGDEQDEYPSAFFGQNHNQSVIRIGSFVQLIKQK